MKRRGFLASSAAMGFLSALPTARVLAGPGIASTAVVITDISAKTEPGALLRFAEYLLKQGIWSTCAIRLPAGDDSDARLAKTIQDLTQLGGGVDFAIELPELAATSPYFQSRAVFEARAQLQGILGAKTPPLPFQTVLCAEIEAPAEPTGVRASGVRNVLVRPGSSAPMQSENWGDGVVRFFGGQTLSLQSDFAFQPDAMGTQYSLIFYISAEDLSAVPEGRLASWTAGFAQTLLEQELMGQVSLMTVPDLQLRDDYGFQRLVAVVLDLPDTITEARQQAVQEFQQRLTDLGIPLALKPKGRDFWINQAETDGRLVPITVKCEAGGAVQLSAAMPVGPGYNLRFTEGQSAEFGIDGCALLNLPMVGLNLNLPMRDLLKHLGGADDLVLSLSVDQIASAEANRRVVSALQAMRQDAITRFVTIGELATVLHSDEPSATRHRLTRGAIANAPRRMVVKADGEARARLIDDARLAWSYFEKYTSAITGLCPATVDLRPGGENHQAVTMWDVGSNLNAIVAATELGLIEKQDAEKIFKRILPNLRGRETDNRLLPQGWIRSDRHCCGIRDFNACDGGRLLASLDNVRRRFGMGEVLEKLVGSWDLEKIIVKGEIHSVIDRKFVSAYSTHCGHYAALAFRRWGHEAISPYETFTGCPPGDGEMAMLQAVAGIGPLGTEPLLLEAVELGMSNESGFLADVLNTALEEEYANSGRLLCVSETPIDRSPWFIYQGLELGSGPRSWRLDTVGHQPQYLTAEAANEFLAFSTKAAFLWAAYRPGPFTAKLLSYARQNARNSIGYSSSINLKTQRPTAGYTDLNTNAIILQAIAHMLREAA